MTRLSSTLLASCALLCGLVLSGCDGKRETREILLMPDMHFSPAVKAQEPDPVNEGGKMRTPPEGTIPVGFHPYTITNEEADTLAMQNENPLPLSIETLRTGRKYFNIYCTPCHGATGMGDGTVVRALAGLPQPPSLYSDKIIDEWTDGRIFHVITVGQGNMPAYNTRLTPEKRWAVVHYVRALGRAANPTEEDLRLLQELEGELTPRERARRDARETAGQSTH